MKFNLVQLLVGEPVRVRYVTRFSTCRVLNSETVAEHSYYTALYSMVIADWVNSQLSADPLVDTEVLLRRALLHDLEEARTGDMPRFFKHGDAELCAKIEESGLRAFHEVWEGVQMDEQTRMLYAGSWCNAKDDSPEGNVLAFADFLSVLAYVAEELRSSNRTMREHLISMDEYADSFDHERFEFLRPLIVEAQTFMRDEVMR